MQTPRPLRIAEALQGPRPLLMLSFLSLASTCQEKGQWECDQEPCLVDPDMINAINRGNYG